MAQEIKKIETKPLLVKKFIGIDSYKNTYFIKDMVFYKQGPDGNFEFNDFQLGEITSVDIINPLSIVVFYQDTNVVVLLDNKLAQIERFNFNNLPEFINVGAASNAGNNRLWIFNIDTQQVELFNYRTKLKTAISQPFKGQLLSTASDFNYYYALTENTLRSYNTYGGLLSEKPRNGIEKIIQYNENLVALKGNDLYYLAEGETEFKKIKSLEVPVKDLQLTQDFLYIYDGNNLHTCTITQPKK